MGYRGGVFSSNMFVGFASHPEILADPKPLDSYLVTFHRHERIVKTVVSTVYLINIVQGVLLVTGMFNAYPRDKYFAAIVSLGSRPPVFPVFSTIGRSSILHR